MSQSHNPSGQPPTKRRALLELFVVAAVGGLAAVAFYHFVAIVPAGPVAVVAAVITATGLLHHRGSGWHEFGLDRRSIWKTVALALAGWLLTMIAVQIVAAVVGGQSDISDLDFVRRDVIAYLLMLILAGWGTAAFGEEMLFRGLLLQHCARILGGTKIAWLAALAIQASIFGLLHAYQGPTGMILTGSVGFMLGAIYLLSRQNLWVVILIHGITDTLGLTVLYLDLIPAAGSSP